jgi:hypothetical protein
MVRPRYLALSTVLGPLLFLVYINDMPPCVSSRERLFADDCLLYRPIKTETDATSHSRVVEFQEKTSVGNFIEGL